MQAVPTSHLGISQNCHHQDSSELLPDFLRTEGQASEPQESVAVQRMSVLRDQIKTCPITPRAKMLEALPVHGRGIAVAAAWAVARERNTVHRDKASDAGLVAYCSMSLLCDECRKACPCFVCLLHGPSSDTII